MPDPLTTPPLRVGILGTANIARSFVAGVKPSKRVTVSAVASRDADKARHSPGNSRFARHFGSYEAVAGRSPTSTRSISRCPIACMPNGRSAPPAQANTCYARSRCRQPPREARAMFDAARRHGVHLVEGYPYRAQPQTLKLRELLDAGVIGDVRLIQASFGFTLGAGENIRLSPQLAGGALMDIGTYPVSLVANDRESASRPRSRGGAVDRRRRRSRTRRDARVRQRTIRANHLQLQHLPPSPGADRRFQRCDSNHLSQSHLHPRRRRSCSFASAPTRTPSTASCKRPRSTAFSRRRKHSSGS